jgi:hypothetical protein
MYIISQAPAAAALTLSTGAATAAFLVAAGEPGAGTQCNVSAPGSNRLNGQPFIVRAAGYVQLPASFSGTTSATPLQLCMLAGPSPFTSVAGIVAPFSNTAVVAFTGNSSATQVMPFSIAGQFQGGPGASSAGTLSGGAVTGSATVAANYLSAFNLGGQILSPGVAGVGVNLITIPTLTTLAVGGWNPLTEPSMQFTISLVTAASNLLGGASGVAIANLTSLVLEA